nr:bifunctional DNA primase/polymerase [Streptomyces coryli]
MNSGPSPTAAADLAGRGLAVFPLSLGSRRPAGPGWQHTAMTDPELIRRTWRTGDNIGVACRPSRLTGLDLDEPDGGVDAFTALCGTHGQPWPDTLTVRTPRGGLHLYFRAPAARTITSSSDGRAGLGAGIDVRAPGRRSGGYLIGPGSIVAGTPYAITHDAPIRPLPAWLRDLLTPARERATRDAH